jgi:hypothetical protein
MHTRCEGVTTHGFRCNLDARYMIYHQRLPEMRKTRYNTPMYACGKHLAQMTEQAFEKFAYMDGTEKSPMCIEKIETE